MSHRFYTALAAAPTVIPDIKAVSPKHGDLLRGRSPLTVAKELTNLGAPCLSVVTEAANFGGSPTLLQQISASVSVPLLRKDFIETSDDLAETLDLGASAVLLIAATLTQPTLGMLYEQALHLGLEPLVEVHTPEEMTFAAALGPRLLGINNRDILNLERDGAGPGLTQTLAPTRPPDALLISESGILSPADVRRARLAGADAVLVGTALWQASDMAVAYRELCATMQHYG
ncbi:MAG: indole-3-glycerol-phosphate synthase [Promicromonosporaceae bacterium]|nr:indole-3-glycerol-phosphate synthase [Promicromonosporaceae bacterium]